MIEVAKLSKRYGDIPAVRDVSFTAAPGQILGFLGPNGAGKTTTLRILLGLLRADSGDVQLLGGDPWRDATDLHRRLAYVPGEVMLWPHLTGGEVIDLLGRMRGGLDPKRRRRLIERFDLDPTKKGRTYSKGNRQKVALIAALASDVELLLLDEPTAGLDPITANNIMALIVKERDLRHATTVIVTQRFQDGEIMAKYRYNAGNQTLEPVSGNGAGSVRGLKFLVVQEGRLVFEGTEEELQRAQDPYISKFVLRH